MKAHRNWSYETGYVPFDQKNDIYICQVVPGENKIDLAWYGGEAPWQVLIRERKTWQIATKYQTDRPCISIVNLSADTDYEFYVVSGTMQSHVGFARTGHAPGTVVNYLHPKDIKYDFSGRYLCTPSLLQHPDGYLLASMDLYAFHAPQNLTLIFRSDDHGKSWYHYTELFPCFWGELFLHHGDVYMLATSTEYGDLLIGRSSDGGKTFGEPTVILRGSCSFASPGWHKSSMPMIEHKGRLWTGIDYGAHSKAMHSNGLLSVPVDADLLDADSWTMTELLHYDPTWEGAVIGDSRGFIEGNAIVLPDGEIGEILRYSTDQGTPRYGLVPVLRGCTEKPEAQLKFEKFAPFQGNLSKFNILFDEVSKRYYTVYSRITDEHSPRARNVLSLGYSENLREWVQVCDLLDYSQHDPQEVGFQYVSFRFDGEDLIYLCRTAVNKANNFHDSNYITFHRVEKFRSLKENV